MTFFLYYIIHCAANVNNFFRIHSSGPFRTGMTAPQNLWKPLPPCSAFIYFQRSIPTRNVSADMDRVKAVYASDIG